MGSNVDCSHSPPLKPEAGPCYTGLSLLTSSSTLGAVFFLNPPSNLTKFSLYGCAAPSKTKSAYQLVQTSYKIRIPPRPWKASYPPVPPPLQNHLLPGTTKAEETPTPILPPPQKKEKKLTLQSLQPRFSQPILRQHPSNRPLQHLSPTPLPHHPLHIQALQRPRPRRLLIIQLLFHFPSRHIQVCASCGYHIIPAISRWVPDRFMFAH